MSGRLNLFQRMMFRWSDLHPYSGVHVVQIGHPLVEARLAESNRLAARGERSDRARCRSWGDAGFVTKEGRRRWLSRFWRAHGTRSPSYATPSNASSTLPFRTSAGRIRSASSPSTDADSFHLGLAYDHFIAGGESIALLLKGITDACSATHRRERPRSCAGPLPPTYRGLIVRHPLAFLHGLFGLRDLLALGRRSFRPRYRGGDDPQNAIRLCKLGSGQLAALRRAGKAWGVTINDLFLASLLQALSPLAADRRFERRRRELAVASIVNARDDFGADPRSTFGQFLASFRIAHPVPEGIRLRELVQYVHAETTRIKRHKLYLQTIVALSLSSLMWRFLSVPRIGRRFFAKHYASWGGVTVLNVDALWAMSGADSGAAPGLHQGGFYRAAVSDGTCCHYRAQCA